MPQNDHFTFGPQVCGTLSTDAGAGREWLLTDGLGGYASGTVSGLRTRRQHTLLTVDDQGTRRAALVSLDLTVTLPSGAKVTLGTHEWESGAIAPAGHRHLESFVLDRGLPRWRWRIGDVVIERELALRHGHPSLAVVDRVVSAPAPVTLAAAAMCTWRDAHASRHAGGPAPTMTAAAGGAIVAGAYRLAGPGWQPSGVWHYGVRTREDGAVEDLWLAGTFYRQVAPGESLRISAWAGDLAEEPPPPPVVLAAERERAHRLVTAAKAEGYGESLALAADKFVIRAATGPDVIAGYPWRGSDLSTTMTAYEGLFLDTGRPEEGRELLIARTRAAAGTPGPPDAPLWLVHAVDRHVTRTGDSDLAAELAAPLARLMRQRLTGPGPLAVDPGDGLLRTAAGKPVDVNALWVNALAAMGDLLSEGGYDDGEPRARHARARTSFLAAFPAPEGWLHDVVEGPAATYPLGAGAHTNDPSLRPGQLLAWSLPHGPMRGQDGGAVGAIGSALLTPLGLRTLAANEYGYRGDGDQDGAVLPWLIGPYADACRATGRPVEGLLTGLEAHLAEYGVGSVSERADGEPPHRAGGCPFAAKPVAEMLRLRGGLE
ncbi:glycogen debranching protein [Actinoplanes sp. OR16]|uniref:glycogen debranching enzyme N-terminal domain-containing protein n=1 Tax=Actinoplanes sp. OR16 TaxID=946334 RepID=UPI000F6D5983|nr:glycogen debranching enzyme N-terminal domain-containing protein [Actinoplanes sp. OR16]BBH63728.1 glycogen debranching protein [Actinoplanes sp. OR16]